MSENHQNRRQGKQMDQKGIKVVLAKKKGSSSRFEQQQRKILLKPDRDDRPTSTSSTDPPILSQEFTNRHLQSNTQQQSTQNAVAENLNTEIKHTNRPIELISASSFVNSSVQDYMQDSNTLFKVIGIVGGCGVGKSTLLNCLTEPEPFKINRSEGVKLFITKERNFLVDTWPMMGNVNNPGNQSILGEIEELKTMILLLKVCHTVVVVLDGHINMNLIRLIRCAEIMDFCFDKVNANPEFVPNLVFVQNKAKPSVINLKNIIKTLFRDSTLNIYKDSSLKELNLISIPLQSRNDFTDQITKFRRMVFQSQNRQISSQSPFNETLWFQMVQQLWKLNKTNYFLNKYEKMYLATINAD